MLRRVVLAGMLASGWVMALSTPAVADPSYIYALHDAGGEANMSSNKGWIVFTEAIGHTPTDLSGGNYTTWSNQGYGVVVRLNNGYGSDGTIPADTDYGNFATRCANFVSHSSGVLYWIIGNETNLPREWPGNNNGDPATGQPITVARYVNCYNQCYTAIKNAVSGAKLMPTPSGTWGPPYAAQGLEGFLDYWVNILNGIGAAHIDALALHCYTHGCDPGLVTDPTKMGPPYQNIYYNFQVYKNYMAAIPASMNAKPVLITECDQNIDCADGANPKHAWDNVNNGWVRAIYGEINSWNTNSSQKIRCVALFRWPMDVEGAYTFGLQDRDQVMADFQQAVAFGYQWGTASQPPSAPTGLSASPGDTLVSLAWNAPSGASSYNVKRSTTSGGSYSTIATNVTTISYTNTGLTNGTTYYYVVSAVNGGGESANSSQVSATPAPATMNGNTPTGTNLAPASAQWATDSDYSSSYNGAKAIDGVISAGSKWTSNGNSPPHWLALDLGNSLVVNGFIVRHASAGGEQTYYNTNYFSLQSGTSLSGPWTDENVVDNSAQAGVTTRSYVTPKTLRYVRLYITNAGIDNYARIPEFEVWGSSSPQPPPVPTGLAATPGNTQVSLTWNASAGATSYNVKRSTTSGGPYPTIASPTTASYTNTSLTNGTTYYYVVSAVNAAGESTNSGQVSATPSNAAAAEDFESLPSWASTFDATWGNAATWSIVAGGQSGNCLQASRTGNGSSVKTLLYNVSTNTNYTLSVYIRCPSGSATYWAETAYKLGNNSAQDFDANPNTWTMVQRFADTGPNGNGDVWTQYSASFNSGSSTQISVGFKLGSSGTNGPVVKWDMLRLQAGAASPTIALSPTSLSASTYTGASPASQSFTVQNTGGGTLTYSIGDNQTWLSVNPTGGSGTGELDTITVTYSTASLTAATYNATITVSDSNATNNPQTVGVTLTVLARPTIACSPTVLSPSCTQGSNAASQSFTVQNTGANTLNYSVGVNQTWLSVTSTGGTGTGELDTITVNYATSGLTAGTYNASISVSDVNATNTPQSVGVTLTVNAPNTVKADFDHDGDVDQDDLAHFQGCVTGSGSGPPAAGCQNADLDSDGDVDQADFGIFQRCLSGATIPADPNCAN